MNSRAAALRARAIRGFGKVFGRGRRAFTNLATTRLPRAYSVDMTAVSQMERDSSAANDGFGGLAEKFLPLG
jgi:hypothetical protein